MQEPRLVVGGSFARGFGLIHSVTWLSYCTPQGSDQSAPCRPDPCAGISGKSDALPVTHFWGSVFNRTQPPLRRERASKEDQPSVPRRECLETHLLYRGRCYRTPSGQGHFKTNELLWKAFGSVVGRLSTWHVVAPQRQRNNTKLEATLPATGSSQPRKVPLHSGIAPISYCCHKELT